MATNKYSDSVFNFSLWIPNKLFDRSRVAGRRPHRHDAVVEHHPRVACPDPDAFNIPLVPQGSDQSVCTSTPVETYNDAAVSRKQASLRSQAEYVLTSIIFRAVQMIFPMDSIVVR